MLVSKGRITDRYRHTSCRKLKICEGLERTSWKNHETFKPNVDGAKGSRSSCKVLYGLGLEWWRILEVMENYCWR